MQNFSSDRAKKTLKFYIKTAFLQSGLTWDLDNEIECDEIVDEIISGAVTEIKKEYEDRIGALENRLGELIESTSSY